MQVPGWHGRSRYKESSLPTHGFFGSGLTCCDVVWGGFQPAGKLPYSCMTLLDSCIYHHPTTLWCPSTHQAAAEAAAALGEAIGCCHQQLVVFGVLMWASW